MIRRVDTALLRVAVDDLQSAGHKLDDLGTRLERMQHTISSDVLMREGLRSALRTTGTKLGQMQESVQGLSKVLSATADNYATTERTLSGQKGGLNSNKWRQDLGSEKEFANYREAEMSRVVMGVAGAGITCLSQNSSIFEHLAGFDWDSTNINPGRLDAAQLKIARKLRMEKLIFGDVFAGNRSTAPTWIKRFGENLTKAEIDPIKCPALIGTGLTLAENVISNYQEFKEGEIDVGRAVTETAMETVVDVGLNIAIGTAVAAGIGAVAGVVAAPAVLVVATTMLVTVGANWICEEITGRVMGEKKDLTEFISDGVLDFLEGANAKVGELGSQFGSFLKKSYKSLGKSGFTPLFSA